MSPYFKPAALAIACLTVLFMIIGLATPLWTADYTVIISGVKYTYTLKAHIKDRTIESSTGGAPSTKTTTDQWDADCNDPGADECKTGKAMSKAGFAFVFLGMLVNVAFIISLVKANGVGSDVLPSPLGEKMPTAGIAGVLLLFYFLGAVLAIHSVPASIDTSTDLGKLQDDKKKLGAGSAFLIIGLFSTVGAAVLAFLGMNDEGAPDSVAAPAGAIEAAATTDEAPANGEVAVDFGDDTPPPGGVYMKNGVWLDKDSNPVK